VILKPVILEEWGLPWDDAPNHLGPMKISQSFGLPIHVSNRHYPSGAIIDTGRKIDYQAFGFECDGAG